MVRHRSGPATPRFSVVMPAHDCVATLDAAISSVLDQSYQDLELLVIENGSSDETLESAMRWSARDPRVYVTTLEVGDVALARNAGIQEARGDYVTFLDADDVYLPGYLEFLDSAVREYPGRTMYTVGGVSVAPDGARSPVSPSMPKDRPRELTLADVAWMTLFPNQVAYPVEELRKLGGYRRYYIEDYDLWLHTLAAGGTGIYLPGEFSEHRIYLSSRSHDPAFYEHSVDSALASLRDALTFQMAEPDRTALERRVTLLERRRERISARAGLEKRLRAGHYARARRDYLHAMPAYRSRSRALAGLVLIMVSPRLFARVMMRREATH